MTAEEIEKQKEEIKQKRDGDTALQVLTSHFVQLHANTNISIKY